jgi:hypothetical protein
MSFPKDLFNLSASAALRKDGDMRMTQQPRRQSHRAQIEEDFGNSLKRTMEICTPLLRTALAVALLRIS